MYLARNLDAGGLIIPSYNLTWSSIWSALSFLLSRFFTLQDLNSITNFFFITGSGFCFIFLTTRNVLSFTTFHSFVTSRLWLGRSTQNNLLATFDLPQLPFTASPRMMWPHWAPSGNETMQLPQTCVSQVPKRQSHLVYPRSTLSFHPFYVVSCFGALPLQILFKSFLCIFFFTN